MKALLIIIISFCFFQTVALAQPGERVKQLKIAYITEQLSLSVEESQAFWPIYNAHESKRDVLEKSIRKNYRKIKDLETPLTESQLKKIMDEITSSRIEIANLDREFIQSCIPVLGTNKSSRLVIAEEGFKKEIMRELKGSRDRQE